MKKFISSLCLGALFSFATISCQSGDYSVIDPSGPQKGEANAKKQAKITICHQTGSGSVTISVNANAWDAHEKHGDYLGECNSYVTPE